MISILGAGGVIANEVGALLAERKEGFRLVSRSPRALPGSTDTVAADLTDREQTIAAVTGSSTVLLLAGLKYDVRLWAQMWPAIMANVIEACKRANARLLFFDNVYMYGKVDGAMTEETPFNPCSAKGEIRAKIATSLIDEWKSGSIQGMIARAADFYGPHTPNGIPNLLVFAPLSKGGTANWLGSDAVPHSYTYTVDAAQAVVRLIDTDSAWNQTWHLPTAPNAPSGKEFVQLVAGAFGVAPKYRKLNRLMVRLAGLFDRTTGEVAEMFYQNDSPYVFDSSKYAQAFGFAGTPYADSVAVTAASYR